MIRSALFNAIFYINLIVWMIIALPSLVLPRQVFMAIARMWARSSMWWLRVICGTQSKIIGTDNILTTPCIVAAKHQSFWETFALFQVCSDPVFILKRELTWIPMFGWYLWKSAMIPINRAARSKALDQAMVRAREELAKGRQLIIFPEGTRRAAGAEPAYKFGVSYIYEALKVPVIPVGLNSGLFWPRRAFIRRPGTIVAECLPALPADLPRHVMFEQMQAAIEASSDRLLDQGLAELGPLAPPDLKR
ncbi:MAG: lysophospholipid acyltransferase family protein [Beijerinckiaceae bacterium]